MAIPAYVELYDAGGSKIEGSSIVANREGMVEVIGFEHMLCLPTDPVDGKITGTRRHGPLVLLKTFDKSSPFLYESLVQGKELQKVIIHWYTIDRLTGQEVEYFTHTLEKALIIKITAEMRNTNLPEFERLPHLERVELRYDRITWKLVDGNIEKSDSWIEDR
jgi:type VI secretion system secreted protein Hcp